MMQDLIRFKLIDKMVDVGRIDQDFADKLKDAVGYIPFDRINDLEKHLHSSAGPRRGIAAIASFQKIQGSKRQIGSTMDAFSGFETWATKQIVQTNASRRAVHDLEITGNAVRGNVLPWDSKGKHFFIYENGQRIEYTVADPALAVAFLADPEGDTAMIFEALQKMAQLLRIGVTVSPIFTIKQVMEDIPRAMLYSGVDKPWELIPRILKNFPVAAYSMFRGKQTAGMKALSSMGIVGTHAMDTVNSVKEAAIEAGVAKRGTWGTILYYGEIMSRASDLSVRQAIFEQTMKESGDEALAETRSREIINFSRRGQSSLINNLARTVPFMNATIQGMDKIIRAATVGDVATGLSRGEARAMFWRRAGYLTSGALAYALMMTGDDEYESQEDYVRFNNWLIPGMSPEFKEKLGFTPAIPVPREIGLAFKVIPELVVSYFKNHGTQHERDALQLAGALGRQGLNTFWINPTPAAFKTLAENLTNYSLFLGRPLESAAQQKLLPHQRYGASTSPVLKDIMTMMYKSSNGQVDISPIMMENAIRGIFGTTAGLMLAVGDTMLNPDSTSRPLHKALSGQLTGAAVFMQPEVGSRWKTELYDMDKEIQMLQSTLRKMEDTASPEEIESFERRHRDDLTLADSVHDMLEHAQEVDKDMKLVSEDTSMSREARLEEMALLRRQAQRIAAEVQEFHKIRREDAR